MYMHLNSPESLRFLRSYSLRSHEKKSYTYTNNIKIQVVLEAYRLWSGCPLLKEKTKTQKMICNASKDLYDSNQ